MPMQMPEHSERGVESRCPACGAGNPLPFRALRSSTVYVCRDCGHKWEGSGYSPVARSMVERPAVDD
jgi:ribosomal protein L37AE/L43A